MKRRILFLLTFICTVYTAHAQSIVVNKMRNGSNDSDGATDAVELLVIQDHLDIRNFIIKDFDTNTNPESAGKYQFKDIPFWSDLRSGTTIVLNRIRSSRAGYTEDVDASDFTIDIIMDNADYLTNVAPTPETQRFNITSTDMVMIKTGEVLGTENAIHALATGNYATYVPYMNTTSPKLATATAITGGNFAFPLNPEITLADFDGVKAGTTNSTSPNWGSGYGQNNIAYIRSLRAAIITPAPVTNPIVVNKIFNGTSTSDGSTDAVEFLVIQDNFDARNLVFKDFESNGSQDNGGKYRFNDIPFWQSLRSGTTIVLRKLASPDPTYVQDTDPSDFTIDLLMENTAYLTLVGPETQRFNLTITDMVVIKSGEMNGLDNIIHGLASNGNNTGSLANTLTAPLLLSLGENGTGSFQYPLNPDQAASDYRGTKAAGSNEADKGWGVGFGEPNITYIASLRSAVAPAAPGGLTATANSANQITLTWADNSTNETGFEVDSSTDGTTFALLTTTAANLTTFEHTGLTASTAYTYRVRAAGNPGKSAYSANATATTPQAAPTAPSQLVATTTSAAQIDLVWADNSDNETGFDIERSADGTAFTALASVGANTTTYSNTGLTANTQYFYRVRASGGASGNSTFSNTSSATTMAAPAVAYPSIVVNRIRNGSNDSDGATDAVELLVIQDRLDIRGFIVKDFDTNTSPESAGKYRFKDVPLWADLRSGTTIVLHRIRSSVAGYTEDTDASDFTIDLLMENETYMENAASNPGGMRFNITSSDVVMVKTGTPEGTENAIHALGTGSVVGTNHWQAITAPKLHSAAAATITANRFAYPLHPNGNGNDYSGEKAATSNADPAWGVGFGEANVSFIASLRASVATSAPDAPTALTATANTSTQITLTWVDNSATETGFEIETSANGTTFTSLETVLANATSFVHTGLTASTQYFYRVRALGGSAGNSTYSNIANATTPATTVVATPPIVVNKISNFSSTTDGAGDAAELLVIEDNYDLRNVIFKDFESSASSDNGGKYRFNDIPFWQNLKKGTTIVLRRLNGDAAGYVEDTDPSDFTIDILMDNATYLTNVAASPATQRYNLTITDIVMLKTGDAAGTDNVIHAFASNNGNNTSLFNGITGPMLVSPAQNGTGAFSYPLNPNQNASDYLGNQADASLESNKGWGVGFGEGNIAYIALLRGVAVPVPPAAPSGLVATAASPTQIDLVWVDNSDNETGFEVQRSADGTTFTSVTTTAANATSYSNSGLLGATQYFYQVRAIGAVGNSAFTSVANATTPASPPAPPAAPSALAATSPSPTQVNLTWTDNATNETGFNIQRSLDGTTFTDLATVGENVVSYSNTGLTANTQYHYRVRASGAVGNSEYTSAVSVTTLATAVAYPSIVVNRIRNGSNDSDGATDAVELLVIQDRLDIRGFIVKDFDTNTSPESAGKYRFKDVPLWADLRSGTTIVLHRIRSSVAGYTEDTDASDFTIDLLMENETYMENAASNPGGMRFNITSSDVVMVKTGTPEGTENAIHALGTGSVVGTNHWQAITAPKLHSAAAATITANRFAYPLHPNGNGNDYSGEKAATSNADPAWGVGFGEANVSFIASLRASVATSAPDAPTALTATANTSTQITLTWVDNSATETGFEIETSPTGTSFVPLASVLANTTTYVHTGLTANTPYFYRVRATGGAVGNSAYSNIANVTTPAKAVVVGPPIVVNKISNVTSTTDGASDGAELLVIADNYDLRNVIFKDLESSASNDNGGKYRFNDIPFWQNLKSGTTIVLRRLSSGVPGYVEDTDPSDFTIDILMDNTELLTNVSANPATQRFNLTITDIVMLKTGDAAGVENVIHAFASNNGNGTSLFNSIKGPMLVSPAENGTGFFNYPLNPSQDASDYLGTDADRSNNPDRGWGVGFGQGNIDYIASLRLQAQFPAPSNVEATAATQTQVNVNWTYDSEAELGFEIERSLDAATFTPLATVGPNVTTYQDNTVQGNRIYFYRIRAFGQNSFFSDYSAVARASTNIAIVTDVAFTPQTLYENRPAETVAGILAAVSDNPTANYTYGLAEGAGDTDNALFKVVGNEVRTVGPLNFEGKPIYSIRVRGTSGSGSTFEKAVSVTVLDVNEAPTMAAIANQVACASTDRVTLPITGISGGPETGQTVSLTVSSNNSALFSNLSVTMGTGGNAVLAYTLNAGIFGTANVTVTAKDNGGTANNGIDTFARTFVVTSTPLPTITIASDRTNQFSKGQTAVLTASGASTYVWTDADGIISGQNTAALTIRPAVTTTYQVTGTGPNGCRATESITITVVDDFSLLVSSNLLTPNHDGVNDTWVISNLDLYTTNEVKVFDKAGRVVFSQKGYNNTWNGTYQNAPLAEGTYYYIVTFGPGQPTFKGFITLIKE